MMEPKKYAIDMLIEDIIDTLVDEEGHPCPGLDVDIRVRIGDRVITGFLPDAPSDYKKFKALEGKTAKLIPQISIGDAKKTEQRIKSFANTSRRIGVELRGEVVEIIKGHNLAVVDCGFPLLVSLNRQDLKIGDWVEASGRLDFKLPESFISRP
jgi:hypothetical protein